MADEFSDTLQSAIALGSVLGGLLGCFMTPAIWKGKTKRFWPYVIGLMLATEMAFFLFAGLNSENVSDEEPWATVHDVIVKNVVPFCILMTSVAGLFCFCAVWLISLSSSPIK